MIVQKFGTTVFDVIVSELAENVLLVLAVLFLGTWFVAQWVFKVNLACKDQKKSADWLKKIHGLAEDYLGNGKTRASSSPITLTPLGKEIAAQIKAEEWIGSYAAERLSYVEGMTPYRIQEDAFRFAEEELLSRLAKDNKDLFIDIERCAFERGIDVGQVMKAVGVVLRDRLLELTNQVQVITSS